MQAELREWLGLAPERISALRASLPATVRGRLAMRGLSGSVHAPSAFDALALAGLASLAETVTPARLGLLRRGHARPPSGGAWWRAARRYSVGTTRTTTRASITAPSPKAVLRASPSRPAPSRRPGTTPSRLGGPRVVGVGQRGADDGARETRSTGDVLTSLLLSRRKQRAARATVGHVRVG